MLDADVVDTRPTVKRPYRPSTDPRVSNNRTSMWTTEYQREFGWKGPPTYRHSQPREISPRRVRNDDSSNLKITFETDSMKKKKNSSNDVYDNDDDDDMVVGRSTGVQTPEGFEARQSRAAKTMVYREVATQTLESALIKSNNNTSPSRPVKAAIKPVVKPRPQQPVTRPESQRAPTPRQYGFERMESDIQPAEEDVRAAGLPSGPDNLDPNRHSFLSYGWANENPFNSSTDMKTFNVTADDDFQNVQPFTIQRPRRMKAYEEHRQRCHTPQPRHRSLETEYQSTYRDPTPTRPLNNLSSSPSKPKQQETVFKKNDHKYRQAKKIYNQRVLVDDDVAEGRHRLSDAAKYRYAWVDDLIGLQREQGTSP